MSFERSWNAYVAGFGNINGNFWLGLEAMHDLTATCAMSLQIDVVPFYRPAVSIFYEQFHVGDAASEYLLTVSSDSTSSDPLYRSFNYHSGRKFATIDRPQNGGSCLRHCKVGWWYINCFMVNLNGFYGGASEPTQQTNLRCNNVLATSTFCCDNVNYPRCHNVNLSIPRNVVTTYNITFPID